jgi:KDO2-lipid IV(A) lauroyltransferase
VGRILFRRTYAGARRLRDFGPGIEAAVLRLFWELARHLRADHACATGRSLVRWMGPKTHKHRLLMNNLRLTFPEYSDAEVEALARTVWANFGMALAEVPHLHTMTVGGPSAAIDVNIDDAVRPVLETRRPAIYVSAHLANWEAAAFTIAKLGVPLTVVYGPQNNRALDKLIQSQRHALGCQLVAKHSALQRLIRDIRAGRSVGLLADQRVDTGAAVPFFGVNAPTTTSPAWLACKLGCPLVPVQIERLGKARLRATFHRPLATEHTAASEADIVQTTTELNRLFETWIRNRPEQWLCLKRRWPAAAYET